MMDVRAVFELPMHIWITCDALGKTYPTGFGPVRFNVVMPGIEPKPLGGPPAVAGVADHPDLSGEDVVWARTNTAGWVPESLRPAATLHRVALTDVEAPVDERQAWRTADAQLAEYVEPWYDNVRTWVEILTGQDLDPKHRVYDAKFVGEGLTFIEPPHDDAIGMQLTTPHVLPLRAKEWQLVLRIVAEGAEPPVEEMLSRDARAALRRNAPRRAALEAATAVEVVLSRHVREKADSGDLPENQRKRIKPSTALGDFIDIAERSNLPLAVTFDRLRLLKDRRNKAAHEGKAPTTWDASESVQTMIDFLGAHGLYRRTGEREPDGGELLVAPASAGDDASGETAS